ncbi:calcium-binding protein, partial [Phaeobacter sp. B1627]
MQEFTVGPEATDVCNSVVENTFLSLDGQFRNSSELDAVSKDDLLATAFPGGLEPSGQKHTVYNFEVEDTHTYIAGGYRVHNQSTLAFLETEDYDRILDVFPDANGNLVVVTETDGGNGRRTTVATEIDPVTGTSEVTSNYVYTVRDGAGNVLFYLDQTEVVHEGPDGKEVQSIVINEFVGLGDRVGSGVGDALTPFILDAIGVDTVAGKLVVGTLTHTILQNLAEGGINAIQHTLLDARQNGDTVETIFEDAWDDFGIDLGINAINGVVSLTSQFILAEVFESIDVDGVPGAILEAVLTTGIENIISTGIDNFLGETLTLGQAYQPTQFNVSTISSAVFSAVLNEILPTAETVEGQIGSQLASVFANGFGLGSGLGFFGPILVPALIGTVVGKLLDAIFDKDPQAFANLEFDLESGSWRISSTFVDDGGTLELATTLANNTAKILNEFRDALQATEHNYDDASTIRIGHYEEHLRNGNGTNYAMGDSNVILSAVVATVEQLRVEDGDLKVARALDLENLTTVLAEMDTEEAFSHIYSRMRIARDYQTYLENTEAINLLMTTAPDSPVAQAWLATILSANEMGLSDGFTVTGSAGDNLFLTSDGDDVVDGAAGDDEIRSYDGNDTLDGGAGDDLISGGVGADTIDGGTGIDTVTFDDGRSGVSLSLHLGSGLTADAEGDTYTNIENAIGSSFDDNIVGALQSNELWGNSGNDSVYGHGGDDTLHGDEGDDLLFGDLTEDTSVSGDDLLYGDAGDDILHGGGGFDTFDGGEGNDRASYRFSTLGLIASLASNEAKISGGIETFTGIEGLIGSAFTDYLYGNSAANTIEGLAGNDV